MPQPLIAVVNDDTDFLALMYELLTGEGYRCVIYNESDQVYAHIKAEHPDLVTLDIRMGNPEAGWTILELLRLDPTTAPMPVIVCSADTIFLRAKEAALRALHCDILEKPFDLDALLLKIVLALETLDHSPS
jgi:CheY-like chemotaxis protein